MPATQAAIGNRYRPVSAIGSAPTRFRSHPRNRRENSCTVPNPRVRISRGIITRMPLLETRGVGHRYGYRGPWVLRDVNLTLPKGMIVEVTGRNGAGKSTLLRLLAGVAAPSRGTVTGRPGTVGYAPERFPMTQPFTVRGYLTHMARLRGLNRPKTTDALDTLAGRLGLDALFDTRLRDLSKGSAQKVGLGQALLVPPALLVADEPFSGLDAASRDALPRMFEELADAGGSVVFSDHARRLGTLCATHRWHVADGAVRPAPAREPVTARTATLELTVDQDEAEQVEKDLRTRGYRVRRTR